MRSQSPKPLPLPVKRTLKKLGADMADARKRRRISTSTMAQRAMISRTTLVKVEKGDPGVSIGVIATVIFVLGMTDRLADIADADGVTSDRSRDLVAIDDALRALANLDPRKAQIVELRFFGGLGLEEIAEVIGVAPVTVSREWAKARAWLHREIGNGQRAARVRR